MFDKAQELSRAQAKATGEAARAMSSAIGAMLEISAAFARASAERNAEYGRTLMSAKTLEGAAEIHGAFMRDSMRASSVMATKLADVCMQAARQCQGAATQALGVADEPAGKI